PFTEREDPHRRFTEPRRVDPLWHHLQRNVTQRRVNRHALLTNLDHSIYHISVFRVTCSEAARCVCDARKPVSVPLHRTKYLGHFRLQLLAFYQCRGCFPKGRRSVYGRSLLPYISCTIVI